MFSTKDGKMIILSSPSGAGKTTLVKKISREKNYKISISHTTRAPRSNEIDGVDYFFITQENFQNLINKDSFLEYANVFKNLYGSSKEQVFKSLDNEKNTSNLTIFAKRAKLLETEDSILILENGTIHSENKDGEIKAIDFQKTRLGLSGMKTKSITQAKVQETKSMILLECAFGSSNRSKILNCPSERKVEVLAEINRRFGMPLYIPFVALLCSFLLINREENKFGNLFKYIYGGLSFMALVIAEILVRYSGSSYSYALIYYLIPIILIPILYLEILRKFSFENYKR